MADISKLKTPDGTTYSLKDETARAGLAGKAAAEHTHNYLPLAGGEMNGTVKWNSNSLPEQTAAAKYLVCIDAFVDGGTMKWKRLDSITVGNADTVDGKHASDFAAASHTHTKSQITDFPTIPTKTSQLTNDSGFKTTDSNTTYSLSKSGSTITLTGSDGSTTSVTDSNTTYSTATQSADGLMSADDKAKLDGLSDGVFDNDVTFNGSKVNHVISPSDSFTQDNIYKRSDSENPVVSAEYYRSKADNSENAKYSRIFKPGSTSAYTDLRVTANTSGADWNFIGTGLETRLKVNNNLVYHAGYKPYAMGTVSLAANATKCTVSFGFTPSLVLWGDPTNTAVFNSSPYSVYIAAAFDSTSLTVSTSSSAARSVSYIAFR